MSCQCHRREEFKPYLRQLADLMGLKDWVVEIDSDSPERNDAAASADCAYGHRHIIVALSDHFLSDSPSEQRYVIVHELVHAHLAPLHHYLHRTLKDSHWEGYKLVLEYAVDGVAMAWAPHLPLPPEAVAP